MAATLRWGQELNTPVVRRSDVIAARDYKQQPYAAELTSGIFLNRQSRNQTAHREFFHLIGTHSLSRSDDHAELLVLKM